MKRDDAITRLKERRTLWYWISAPWRYWRADVQHRKAQRKFRLVGYLRFAYKDRICDQFYSLWQDQTGRRRAKLLGDYSPLYLSRHHMSQRLKAWLDGDPGILDDWIEQDMRVKDDQREDHK